MPENEPSPMGLGATGATACPSVGLDLRYLHCAIRCLNCEGTHSCPALGKAPKLFFRVSEWATC